MFCSKCGKEINNEAVVCVHCGCQIKPLADSEANQGKNWIATLLLCFFLGGIGAHRFYTGYIGIGVIQLLTLGGCGIWTLIDLIMILCRNYRAEDGSKLV